MSATTKSTVYLSSHKDLEQFACMPSESVASILFASEKIAEMYDGPLRSAWFDVNALRVENAELLQKSLWFLKDPRDVIGLGRAALLFWLGVRHYTISDASVGLSTAKSFAKLLLEFSVSGDFAQNQFGKFRRNIDTGICMAGEHFRMLDAEDVKLPEIDPSPTSTIFITTGGLGPGGSERQFVNCVLGVRKQGEWPVEVVVEDLQGTAGFFAPNLTRHGVHLSEMEVVQPTDVQEESENILRILQSRAELRMENISILSQYHALKKSRPKLVHSWLDFSNTTAGMAALLAGTPRILLSTRSMSPPNFRLHRSHFRQIYNLLLRHERVSIVNNSKAGARDYASWLGIDAERFHVIHNGIDTDEIADPDERIISNLRFKYGLDPNVPVVGTIMRFSEEKRPFFWIKTALEVLKKVQNCNFLLVGDGPLRSEAQKWIDENGLASHFRLTGVIKETPEVLRLMNCFFLSSRLEGLPNVLLEAQCAGVPVVASSVGGVPEVVNEGRTGWALRGNNPARYAKQIVSILESDEIQERTKSEGPKWVRENFSVDRMVQSTLELYEHMIQSAY